MELKDFTAIATYVDGEELVSGRDYHELYTFAKEQEEHIKCLQEELESADCCYEFFKNKKNPMEMANAIATASYKREDVKRSITMYSVSELRQIAEHLLVYCNVHKEVE